MINAANEKMKGRTEGRELAVGNELVKIYPVQTFISSIKTGNADCVVEIIPRLEANSGAALPPAILKAIIDNVPRVQTSQKQKLLFLVSFTLPAKPTVEWFTNKGAGELAKSLSFETANVTSTQY